MSKKGLKHVKSKTKEDQMCTLLLSRNHIVSIYYYFFFVFTKTTIFL